MAVYSRVGPMCFTSPVDTCRGRGSSSRGGEVLNPLGVVVKAGVCSTA